MRRIKKLRIAGSGVLFVLVAMQFFQPSRNNEPGPYVYDIARAVPVPDSIHTLLKTGCYDCHSNNTSYPWYSNIQPGGWYLARHITQGKAELNFHVFGTYSKRKQRSKLKAIAGQLREGKMPLPSYKYLHPTARFTHKQIQEIMLWTSRTVDSLAL